MSAIAFEETNHRASFCVFISQVRFISLAFLCTSSLGIDAIPGRFHRVARFGLLSHKYTPNIEAVSTMKMHLVPLIL